MTEQKQLKITDFLPGPGMTPESSMGIGAKNGFTMGLDSVSTKGLGGQRGHTSANISLKEETETNVTSANSTTKKAIGGRVSSTTLSQFLLKIIDIRDLMRLSFSIPRGSKNRVKERVIEGSKKCTQITDVAMTTSIEWSKNDSIPSQEQLTKWHKSHRNYFGFEYSGPQPTRGGSVSYVGRYQSTPQAHFEYPEYKSSIDSMPRVLKVWVKHPEGIRTVDQFINARRTARLTVSDFACKHRIVITKERDPGFSEHTAENKALATFLKGLIAEEPTLCDERLGLTVNMTSHKGKAEWTDRKWIPGKMRAKDKVMNFEFELENGASPKVLEHFEKQEQWMDVMLKGQTTLNQNVTTVLGGMGQFISVANELLKKLEGTL